MGVRFALSCVGVAIAAAVLPAAPPQNADLLAPMRAAIGGDAALAAVTRLSVTGSLTRHLSGLSGPVDYEVQIELPDKFVVTTRSTTDAPSMPRVLNTSSWSITSASGFNGGDPISRFVGDSLSPGPSRAFRVPLPTAPADVAERRRRSVSNARREFLRFVLPRFGRSFPGSDVTLEDAGQASIDGRAVYQVKVTDWGSRVHVLAIDAATNLPVRLTWEDRPVVSMHLGTVVNAGVAPGTPPDLPTFPADPTAGMPDVEHVITFKKFKIENGFNWPREMSKTVDGRPTEDWSLGKPNLAPKFTADVFNPSK